MKKDKIVIAIVIVSILLVLVCVYGFIIKPNIKEYVTLRSDETTKFINESSIVNSSFIPSKVYCQKKIDNADLDTYLETVVSYDENYMLIDLENLIRYVVDDEVKYNRIKNDISNCEDNYSTKKEVTCKYKNTQESEYKNTWAKLMIDNLKEAGFTCK